ncbi:hypothetical protein GBA52_002548 [Prunus armeniaca]|nr:hypothetical protein GBA52_002548 [Prunus armeniaca]
MSMRQGPLHAIFGGGKVADILLWKDKTSAATILAVFTIIWLQLEVDTFAAKCIREVKKLFQMFESKVLNKIPGMGKERSLPYLTW